jgi:hypothetical protein
MDPTGVSPPEFRDIIASSSNMAGELRQVEITLMPGA